MTPPGCTVAGVSTSRAIHLTQGTWTIRLDGGPRLAAALAAAIRSGDFRGSDLVSLRRLAAALEQAEFTPEPEES